MIGEGPSEEEEVVIGCRLALEYCLRNLLGIISFILLLTAFEEVS